MNIIYASLNQDSYVTEFLEQSNVAHPAVQSNTVLIEVKACGVSLIADQVLSELFKKRPQLHYPAGYEIAGEVVDAGDQVLTLSAGDRVAGILPLDSQSSGFAQFCVCSEFDVVKIRKEISIEAAAAGIGDGVKSYTALMYLGHLLRNETVLVMDPLTSWGSLLIQLAKDWGARVLAVAFHTKDKSLIQDLDVDAIIEGGATSLVTAVMEETGGLGVDIIVDNGVRQFTSEEDRKLIESEQDPFVPHKHDLINCLAVGGRWITSQYQLQLDPPDSEQLYLRCATLAFLFESTWTLSSSHVGKYQHMLQDIEDKLYRGVLKPNIVEKVTMSNVIDYIQSLTAHSKGKVVLKF